jgi:transcriptional regulator with XRE-family HTH domain
LTGIATGSDPENLAGMPDLLKVGAKICIRSSPSAPEQPAGLDAAATTRRCIGNHGSTQPAIARLEAGGVTPNLDTLHRIAEALGLELIVDLRRARRSA